MAVDQVRDGFICHFGDSLWNVWGIGGRCIHNNDSSWIDHKHRLITVVGNHVEALTKILNAVPLSWIDGRSFRGVGHWKVLTDPDAKWCYGRHIQVRFSGLP